MQPSIFDIACLAVSDFGVILFSIRLHFFHLFSIVLLRMTSIPEKPFGPIKSDKTRSKKAQYETPLAFYST